MKRGMVLALEPPTPQQLSLTVHPEQPEPTLGRKTPREMESIVPVYIALS